MTSTSESLWPFQKWGEEPVVEKDLVFPQDLVIITDDQAILSKEWLVEAKKHRLINWAQINFSSDVVGTLNKVDQLAINPDSVFIVTPQVFATISILLKAFKLIAMKGDNDEQSMYGRLLNVKGSLITVGSSGDFASADRNLRIGKKVVTQPNSTLESILTDAGLKFEEEVG